jgi:methionine biosynthesis protein MetW
MKRDKQKLPTVFHKETYYYQQDWQDYYPTIIKLVRPNTHVLDIGCGKGGLLQYLRDTIDCRVTGLDVSDDAVTACKEKNIEAIKCDVEEDDIPGTYDVIILSAILEHLIDPLEVLYKLRDNLNDNGELIIGVPNFSHLLARLSYLRGKNVKRFSDNEKEYKLGGQPAGHIQFFNKSSLSFLLNECQYQPVQWSYHKSVFSRQSKPINRVMWEWMACKLYTIDHPLFSLFIAVEARKEQS